MSQGHLYSEVQCIMGNGHETPLPLPDRMTDLRPDTTENITFPQLRWRAVIMVGHLDYQNYVYRILSLPFTSHVFLTVLKLYCYFKRCSF